MLIRVTGKAEALEELEKAKALIAEAEKILYRLPNQIGLELADDTKKATVQDNQ